ncbi:EAL domain-containing protein [Maricaulaceae bacterium MS644]
MPDAALKRFVAFAFSAADILIETDLDGRVSFSAGATSTFKTLASGRENLRLETCFATVSQRVIRTFIETAPEEGRAGPVRVWCEDRPIDLSLWRMKGAGSLQWTLRLVKDEALVGQCAFPMSAREVLDDALLGGRSLDLALVWLDGGADIRSTLGDREADQFFTSLTEIAKLHAKDNAAGRIPGSGDLIGLVPADDDALDQLEAEIDEIAKAGGLERVSARTRRMPTGEGSVEDALEIFMEAATRFDETGVPPQYDLLAAAVEKAHRIAQARTDAVTLTVRKKLFEPHVQPIADAKTLDTVDYEMLIRLPGGRSFVPGLMVAEKAGLTEDLDLAMTKAALDFLKVCPDRPDLSVNLSGASIVTDGFGARLKTLLDTARIGPSRLCFEITETHAIKDFERARAVTEGLRKLGHTIALDDFGSGSAGLEYLLKLPVDRVKIDGALMPRTNPGEWERQRFQHLAGFAKGVNAQLVAEFVEHRWQALLLADAGFDLLQGHLIGKAEPLSDLARRHPPRTRREMATEAFG